MDIKLVKYHDVWLTGCVQGVDDINKFWSNSFLYLSELSSFLDFVVAL